ncbi:hypothetical protein GCM10010430_18940 [Kitasatospora cystarginea]|uniref:Uncharacterized protein n=1 Tax=Kitasatospora cystarginea TaxID=58350 RepID=A0ABP5QJW7_9ACTN
MLVSEGGLELSPRAPALYASDLLKRRCCTVESMASLTHGFSAFRPVPDRCGSRVGHMATALVLVERSPAQDTGECTDGAGFWVLLAFGGSVGGLTGPAGVDGRWGASSTLHVADDNQFGGLLAARAGGLDHHAAAPGSE